MAITYNNKKIAEILQKEHRPRVDLKRATGITNETTAIRWQQGEDIYVSKLADIATFFKYDITEFFLDDGKPLESKPVPYGTVQGTRGPKVMQYAEKTVDTVTKTSEDEVPSTASITGKTYTEVDMLKVQLEHQKEIMNEREAYHSLELNAVKKEEEAKTKVREEYELLIKEKNQTIKESKDAIGEKTQIIKDQKAEIDEYKSTIVELQNEILTLRRTISNAQTTPYGLAETLMTTNGKTNHV